MEELKVLEEKIVDRLNEIRNKEQKTLNERDEYAELQNKLQKVRSVMIMLQKGI